MKIYILLLAVMIYNIAYAQKGTQAPLVNSEDSSLYLYLDKSGNYGYADQNMNIRIPAQYKTASPFSRQGYAVVSTAENKKGVIDRNNKLIIPYQNQEIHLLQLEDYTLIQTQQKYHTHWRFWQWKFLPGISFIGSSGDKRLFDTRVKRIKNSVFILGDKIRKIYSRSISDDIFIDKYFNIKTLDSNQIIIDHHLYTIDKHGAHYLAKYITELTAEHTFIQQEGNLLNFINRKGKRINKKKYVLLDAIELQVDNSTYFFELIKNHNYIAQLYSDQEGQFFIYPDFSKALPLRIEQQGQPNGPSTKALLDHMLTIYSVPKSKYFVTYSFIQDKRYIRFLDTEGRWHDSLPEEVYFMLTDFTGRILWPEKQRYTKGIQLDEGWRIKDIIDLLQDSFIRVIIQNDKQQRQGVWDYKKQKWVIAPKFYSLFRMDNDSYWQYSLKKDGLFGIIDSTGNKLTEPLYSSISTSSFVTKKVNGTNIYFYLHLPTLKEFREK